ncbi:MAG: hypothetical protein M9927_03790, partial [Anaerolineae bacterium]|nr:hypothetical protein [Anaerolineae bacterium]
PLGHRRPGANPTAHRPAVRATGCSRPAAHHHVYPTLLPPIPADHNGMLHIEVAPRVAPRSTPQSPPPPISSTAPKARPW